MIIPESRDDFLVHFRKIMDEYNLDYDYWLEEYPEVILEGGEGTDYHSLESMLKDPLCSFQQLFETLNKRPIGINSMKKLFEDSKNFLESEYGLIVPSYLINVDSSLSKKGEIFAKSTVSFIGILDLPEFAGLHIFDIIPHEQGHMIHHENSKLFDHIKHYTKLGKLDEARSLLINSEHLCEGFASFVSMLYARELDLRYSFNNNFRNFVKKNSFLKDSVYFDSLNMFEQIEKRDGIEGVLYAANNLMNDDELRNYVY